MTRADKFLTAAIFLCALLGLGQIYRHLFSPLDQLSPRQATISSEGKVLHVMGLNPAGGKKTLHLSGERGTATVEVEGGRIRMLAASCPNQICVRQGWIENPGASIVCLPEEIIIRIDGPATVDAVTR